MTIEVSQPLLLHELLEALRSTQCVAAPRGERYVEVVSGWPVSDRAGGGRLLDAYLHAWGARKGGWAVRVSC
jgi:hypothetical protein